MARGQTGNAISSDFLFFFLPRNYVGVWFPIELMFGIIQSDLMCFNLNFVHLCIINQWDFSDN